MQRQGPIVLTAAFVAAWPSIDQSRLLNRLRVHRTLSKSTRQHRSSGLGDLRDSGLVVCRKPVPPSDGHGRGNQIWFKDNFQWYENWLKSELGVANYPGQISDLLPAPHNHEPTVVVALGLEQISVDLKRSLTSLAEESAFSKRFVVVAIVKDEEMAAELLTLNEGEKVGMWRTCSAQARV